MRLNQGTWNGKMKKETKPTLNPSPNSHPFRFSIFFFFTEKSNGRTKTCLNHAERAQKIGGNNAKEYLEHAMTKKWRQVKKS